MRSTNYRILLVGASSLLGREIAEELQAGPLSGGTIVLLDSDTEAGKLEEIGGEAAVLQAVEPGSFEGADAVIFASAADAGKYWEDAIRFGAAAVDATGTVQGLPVMSPRLGRSVAPSLDQTGVTAAHPAATMLAAILSPLQEQGFTDEAYATVLQPASENGSQALDELHEQTVKLLSFQSVPTEQHDTQVAFNVLRRLGEESKFDLASTAKLVERQLAELLPGRRVPALQWLQAPVFHGYGISLFVRAEESSTRDALETTLSTDLIEFAGTEDAPAANTSAAGRDRILLEAEQSQGVLRIWAVADNLKLLAQTAVGCVSELLRMRPTGVVQ